jgi:shikimate kinase
MKIFLIGFMGSGKSTIGRKLANYLNYDFVDLDKVIQNEAGMSIADYFKKNGEESFRELERDTLQQTEFNANTVIATGGGAPCHFDNMDWMYMEGKVVYLSMDPKALAERLKHSKVSRPLIKDLDQDELVEYITQKLLSRDVYYKKAHCIVSGLDLTAEKLAGYLGLPS